MIECRSESCLIAAPTGAGLRGYADLYDGNQLVAECLIVLTAPEAGLLRCIFKLRSLARSEPPWDYAR